jgi:hypothetical protein
MFFQCVNMVSIYNSEIDAYFGQYEIGIAKQTITSIIICIAGIAGSLCLGKLLDKYRNYKHMQIYVSLGMSLTVVATFVSLEFGAPDWVSIVITILGGAPMSSVAVVSYQFQAEVIYPISEVQGVSMMNVISKLLTFGHVQLVEKITDDTPDNINYMYGFILWIFLPIVALIPAFLVKEDLRRLNMKDVQESHYVEETDILALNP